MHLDRLYRSTSARLTGLFAALLMFAFVLAAAGAWFATKAAAENQIRERISLEMNALQRELRGEGSRAAIEAIEARAESPGALEYQLTDSSGRNLIGDLKNRTESLERIYSCS